MPGQLKREHRRKSASPSDSRPSAREELMAAGVRLIAERGVEAVNSNVIARASHQLWGGGLQLDGGLRWGD